LHIRISREKTPKMVGTKPVPTLPAGFTEWE
jgi:hypothetical protein